MRIKVISIHSLLLLIVLYFIGKNLIYNLKKASKIKIIKNTYSENLIYSPTKYKLPKDEDFCFSDDLGCGAFDRHSNGNRFKEPILTLSLSLDGEATEGRIIEIGNEIFERYSFRPMEIHFILNAEIHPFINASPYKRKELIWALATMRNNFSKPKFDFYDVRWHSNRIKRVIKQMELIAQKNNEEITGAWIPTTEHITPQLLSPAPTKIYFLIRKNALFGKSKWRYEHVSPGGRRYYRSKSWFSSNSKNKFNFSKSGNLFHIKYNVFCNLNQCGDLVGIYPKWFYPFKYQNILGND